MKSEVLDRPLPPYDLFGLSGEELRWQSHNVKEAFGLKGHPLPEYSLGPLAVRLNYLRARVRETEILGIRAFEKIESSVCGNDIITAMNRLSSAFWWLFCRCAAQAEKKDNEHLSEP
jgi:ethanolamine utilization cobalamin adenosyltransferase